MNYWLFKSEPETFSIDHLEKSPNSSSCWDGVRNYVARNYMRDAMKIGDLGFFYHSNCKIPGIVGIIKISSNSYPDKTSLDPESKYFDPKATLNNPRWFLRDVKLVRKFRHIITLSALRANPNLNQMVILKPGNRLSITNVSMLEWQTVLSMEQM